MPAARRLPPVPAARLQQLTLIAAARVSAARATSPQQITDIVKVTVDDEVNTTTFRAIVTDLGGDAAR